ncbi:MAG: class I SAM-dependent methyltransferase [Anaerolineales bacterium]|nr:class I SAM-dependent methyltransferase [Anaerolineales bacterium]
MNASHPRATRGHGLLEPLLARMRAQRANRLIPPDQRTGRILDIGCGSYPYFLANTSFKEKFAIDQVPMSPQAVSDFHIESFNLNLNAEPHLPFGENFFNAITLLAVVEHLDPTSMAQLFTETHRTLRPGGIVVLTTPAAWSDGLLHRMAHLGLVSAEEIHEHAYAYTLPLIGWYFGQAGFEMRKIKFGYFEFWLNMWATAEK